MEHNAWRPPVRLPMLWAWSAKRRIRSMLKAGLESQPLLEEGAEGACGNHANIRGQAYYLS